METVKGCQYGTSCRNLTCSYNHPGRSDCRFQASCSKPYQCWYNHEIRVMRTDPRECKFMDSCHSSVCIFNHPARAFCPTEESCFDPACIHNHHTLLCKFGTDCKKESCEFRHQLSHKSGVTNSGANNDTEDFSWEGQRQRTKQLRVEDMIISMNFEDQLMFENDIGQYMYTEPVKSWPSRQRREVTCSKTSKGKSLKIKVPRSRKEGSSNSKRSHRGGNLIVLKDNNDENALEHTDLRHRIQGNGQRKSYDTDSEGTKREWRYERKDCYSGVKRNETLQTPIVISLGEDSPELSFDENTATGSPISTLTTVNNNSQLTPSADLGLKSSQSPRSSQQSVGSHGSPRSTSSKRYKGALNIPIKNSPSRTVAAKVKAADIETNAAVAAAIKKCTLDYQEPSTNKNADDSKQESELASADISLAVRFQELHSDVQKKCRPLKRKHVSMRPEVSIKRKKSLE